MQALWPLALLALSPLAHAQCDERKLAPLLPFRAEGFGSAVSASGDLAIVGAPGHWGGFPFEGRAVVFQRTALGWQELEALDNPDWAALGRYLGRSVDLDGGRALVGTERSALVYALGSGQPAVRLPAPPGTATANFGESVALEGDAAIVGAPHLNRRNIATGAVYAYRRTGPGAWSLDQVLLGTGQYVAKFGQAVALSGDWLAVGEPTLEQAFVHLYRRGPTGEWVAHQVLSGTWGFGGRVALDGGRLAILDAAYEHPDGSYGVVHLYRESGGQWIFSQRLVHPKLATGKNRKTLDDIALDGERLAVAARIEGRSAQVLQYLDVGRFELVGQQWPRVADESFGRGVAFAGDELLIGAPGDAGIPEPGSERVVARRFGTDSPWRFLCACNGKSCAHALGLSGCENGVGRGAAIAACGTASASADDLVVVGRDLVPHEVAMLLMSAEKTVNVPFGNGELCLGGAVRRFPPTSSDAAGEVRFGPGLAAYAAANFGASGQLLPGSSWTFQIVYRDRWGPCAAGSNLTNAVSMTFRP